MKSRTPAHRLVLAVLLVFVAFAAVAQETPPWGGLVDCTPENGFDPVQHRPQQCALFDLAQVDELDAEKLLMTSAHLAAGRTFAAILTDAPDAPGRLELLVTSAARRAQLLVARGRWPTEASHDCRAMANGYCGMDRAGPDPRPIHVLVWGDDSETSATGYWHRSPEPAR